MKIQDKITQRCESCLNNFMKDICTYRQISPADHAVSLGNTGESAEWQQY